MTNKDCNFCDQILQVVAVLEVDQMVLPPLTEISGRYSTAMGFIHEKNEKKNKYVGHYVIYFSWL